MSLSFKTVRGEVYSNCDILFGRDPVTVSEDKLSETVDRQGVEKTVQQWLVEDVRLKLVEAPSVQEAPPQGGDDAGDENPDEKPEQEPGDKSKSKGKGRGRGN